MYIVFLQLNNENSTRRKISVLECISIHYPAGIREPPETGKEATTRWRSKNETPAAEEGAWAHRKGLPASETTPTSGRRRGGAGAPRCGRARSVGVEDKDVRLDPVDRTAQ